MMAAIAATSGSGGGGKAHQSIGFLTPNCKAKAPFMMMSPSLSVYLAGRTTN